MVDAVPIGGPNSSFNQHNPAPGDKSQDSAAGDSQSQISRQYAKVIYTNVILYSFELNQVQNYYLMIWD